MPIGFASVEDENEILVNPDTSNQIHIEEHNNFILIQKNIYGSPSEEDIAELKKELKKVTDSIISNLEGEELRGIVEKYRDPALANIKKCPVALLMEIDSESNKGKRLHIIESTNRRCHKKISKYLFKHRKKLEVEFVNLMLSKPYYEVLEFAKKQFGVAYASKLEGNVKEIRFLTEDNYLGLVADGANTLDIIIEIPKNFNYHSLQYKAKGELKIDDSQKDKGIIKFTYKPERVLDPPYKTEKIEIKLFDKNEDIIEDLSKDITLIRPPIILVHGIWARDEIFEPVKESLQDYLYNKRFCCDGKWSKENEGCDKNDIKFVTECESDKEKKATHKIEVVYAFDWEENSADDLIQVAKDFKYYIDEVLEKKLKQEGIKPGKFDIIAHSAGGVAIRYYISILKEHKKIRKFITAGTPHLGEENFNYILNFCPDIYANIEVDYCAAFLQAAAFFKLQFDNSAFELGPYLKQLRPNSQFINWLNSKPNYDDKIEYTFVAGTKGPLSLLSNDFFIFTRNTVIPEAGRIISRIFKGIPVPKEANIILGNLFTMSSEEGYSDGTVHIDSALALKLESIDESSTGYQDNVINRLIKIPKEIIKGKRFEFPSDHIGIIRKPFMLPFYIQQVLDKKGKFIITGSPVNIYAYDREGNHVGIKGDESESEIEGALFFKDGENQFIYLPPDQDYDYKIQGTGDGDFSLTFNEEQDEKYRTISYSGVNVTENTQAEFKPSKNIIKSTLTIDKDGDGNIDNEFYPDSTFEGKIEKTEDTSEEYSEGAIYAPKRFNKAWLLLLIPIAAIIVFSIIRKRKY